MGLIKSWFSRKERLKRKKDKRIGELLKKSVKPSNMFDRTEEDEDASCAGFSYHAYRIQMEYLLDVNKVPVSEKEFRETMIDSHESFSRAGYYGWSPKITEIPLTENVDAIDYVANFLRNNIKKNVHPKQIVGDLENLLRKAFETTKFEGWDKNFRIMSQNAETVYKLYQTHFEE